MTRKPATLQILWIDDAGPAPFRYEIMLLQRMGAEVDFAVTVTTAKRKLATNEYDLIISDILMGRDSSGQAIYATALIRELREGLLGKRIKDVPVVICSAFYDDEIYSSLAELEHIQRMPMPIDFDYLQKVVMAEKA
ncbi:MAG TPA: hypothetical protein VLX28_27410, partial [Thermoanaerobaculia bacterium]|nr:hypothetical protein [Thermoanaerobaculia bacterium]